LILAITYITDVRIADHNTHKLVELTPLPGRLQVITHSDPDVKLLIFSGNVEVA